MVGPKNPADIVLPTGTTITLVSKEPDAFIVTSKKMAADVGCTIAAVHKALDECGVPYTLMGHKRVYAVKDVLPALARIEPSASSPAPATATKRPAAKAPPPVGASTSQVLRHSGLRGRE